MERSDGVLEAREGDGATKAEAAPLVFCRRQMEEAASDSAMRMIFMLDSACDLEDSMVMVWWRRTSCYMPA